MFCFTDEPLVDVVSEGNTLMRTTDAALTDSSISTQGSGSPSASSSSPSGSSRSSPGSEAITSPETGDDKGRKKVRTCYTNEQVQRLLKIFHENPYPDSEHMEEIAKEMGVAENKIKVSLSGINMRFVYRAMELESKLRAMIFKKDRNSFP